jgi:hypothetical protein
MIYLIFLIFQVACASILDRTIELFSCINNSKQNMDTNQTYPGHIRYFGNGTDQSHQNGTSRRVTMVLTSYILPTICCFGILGNILILVVLTRYRVRRTVSTSEKVVHAGLLTMAVSDLLFNISVLPLAFVPQDALLLPAGSFRLFYNIYGTGFITTFSLTSTWLIVISAGLRYVGVCHPLRARYLINRRGIFTSIGVISVVCVLGNLPQFWLHKATAIGEDHGSIIMMIDIGPFSHEHTRGVIYSWTRALFAIFIPGVLLIYFNIRLMVALHTSRRLHADHVLQSNETTRRETGSSNRLTRTLIAVIVMFIVLVYPDSLFDFFTHIATVIDIQDNESVIIARAVVNMLQISNYAFNFVLYCVMNASFRRTFHEFICWCFTIHSRSEQEGHVTDHCQRFIHPHQTQARYHKASTNGQWTAMTMATSNNHTQCEHQSQNCTQL